MRAWWKGLMLVGMLLVGCGEPEPEPEPTNTECTPPDTRDGCMCDEGRPGYNTCTDEEWGSFCFCYGECSPGDKREGCTCDKGRPGYNACTVEYEYGETCFCLAVQEPGSDCDDGLSCTVGETVQVDGTCGGGTSACDEQIEWPECQKSFCDEEAGCSFQNRREGLECDDGDEATIDDKCVAGKCKGTAS